MNFVKITLIIISLLSSKSLFASVMLFDFTYAHLSAENLAGTFIGELQSDDNAILALTNFKALNSGAHLTFLETLSPVKAPVSGSSPFEIVSVSPRVDPARFELTAAGKAVIQDGDTSSSVYENELFSGESWLVSFSPEYVPEPNIFLLMLFGVLALYSKESRHESK